MGRGIGAAVLVALLAACSGGGGDAAVTTTTATTLPASSAPTTTTLSPEAEVEAAYLAYWKMVDRLSAAPDPNDPELEQRAVDPVLSSARDVLTTSAARGEVTVTPPNAEYSHSIQSIELHGTEATVRDCSVDDQVVLNRDGQVIDGAVTTKHYIATLVRTGAVWKVSDVKIVEQAAGALSCGA